MLGRGCVEDGVRRRAMFPRHGGRRGPSVVVRTRATRVTMKAAVNVSAVQVLANVTSQATATTRVNLAVQHLLAAASFSREVGLLEKQHTGEQSQAFGKISSTRPSRAC